MKSSPRRSHPRTRSTSTASTNRPLAKRTRQSASVQRALQMVSLYRRPGAHVVGSLVYESIAYPSDVDAFERVDMNTSAQRAAQTVARALQRLAQRAKRARDVYWIDAKIGQDTRYVLPHCTYKEGAVTYSPLEVRKVIKQLSDEGLLTAPEARVWRSHVRAHPKYEDTMELYDDVATLRVLRWSADEVIDGYKTLRGGVVVSLADALLTGGDLKVDLVMRVDGRWCEVSNFMIFSVRGKSISTNPFERRFISSIANDMLELITHDKYKGLKLAKRLWSLAAYENDLPTLYILAPLMSSSAARMHQVQGSIDACSSADISATDELVRQASEALDSIENASWFDDDEKKTLLAVIRSHAYDKASDLIRIKTHGYAWFFLDATGLLDKAQAYITDSSRSLEKWRLLCS